MIFTKSSSRVIRRSSGDKKCRDLPAFIIRRLPLRFSFDNNYFNDRYQAIPDEGYTAMVAKMLEGVELRLGLDFMK